MTRMRVNAVTLVACVALFSTCAVARAAEPLTITSFQMQTTAATKVIVDHEIIENGMKVCRPCHIVNEPYMPAFMQAGGHPWSLTTTGTFATEELVVSNKLSKNNPVVPTRDPKDIAVTIPAGLLGNPQATPHCPLVQVTEFGEPCPAATQVGVARLTLFGGKVDVGPIVNVTPEPGQSAEFAIENRSKVNFLLTAHLVRGKEGYGFTVVSNGIPLVELSGFELTFWGVPADPSHDQMRGLFCITLTERGQEVLQCESGGKPAGVAQVPFLSLPTDCSVGPEVATMRADSWQQPGSVRENQQYEGYVEQTAQVPGVTGCQLLKFEPGIEVTSDTFVADTPVGLGVNLQVPQVEKPLVPATPHLRDAVVTLPQGMSISPGVVDGIQACNEVGPEGINFVGPESEEVGLNGELQLAPGHCPDASILGTAEAETPLLAKPVKGHVYLARPGCGGRGQAVCTEQDALDGNIYQLYLELGGTGEFAKVGIQIKVRGFVEANPATGQLTAKFLNNPQTPFSELRVRLNGGPRAPLDNPTACGQALTTSDLTPWSEPGITPEGLSMPGTADATPWSFFEVSEGCANPVPLNPGFLAGTVTPQAGQFSAFTMTVTRNDREQSLNGIQLHTPPGLLGMLSSVPLCPEDQANDPAVYGECTASKIGTVKVASGAGSHPFEISGNVYLTGPHGGAPFGLSIVTRAVAGPFNLGLVVVRGRIDVDPHTSELTVTTDESGPYAVPQIIFGVPLRLKRITVNVDRPHFMFNPTNCSAQQISAKIAGAQGAVANVASPFAVGSCKNLAFRPQFAASTSGHTSRANGTSLDVKLSYPKNSMGNEANIARAKVSLPKRLPSRLKTLQQACPFETFEANPASCSPGSIVGVVRANTPLLPVGLSGPVYFVSHGGEAFPNLIVVLQGDGVRVDLVGDTFISKGITSSTFKSVPDVPVNTFELYLPQGPNSALAANGNLCATTKTVIVKKRVVRRVHGRTVHRTVKVRNRVAGSLVMPTEFTAQNGAVLKQNTKIPVSGCSKAKKKRKSKKSGHGTERK